MQTKMQEKLLKKPVWYSYLKAINQISSNQCGQPAEQQQEKKKCFAARTASFNFDACVCRFCILYNTKEKKKEEKKL